VQRLKLLPLGLVFIGACGSTPDATHPPGSDPQPFSEITQASSTTQAELGVVAWWSTITPDGVMNIGGIDATQSERVGFIADGTKLMLRDSHGTFEMDLDGDKVVSSTFGNAGARRTLDLMKMDLTSSDAAPSAAVSPASVSAGELHPTDDACPLPPGSLLEDCSSLFYGDCDKDRFKDCMHDSGSLKAANIDKARESKGAPDCVSYPGVPSGCTTAHDQIKQWQDAFASDGCYMCAPQWNSTPSDLLNCPDSAWDYNPNAGLFGWGVYNYCRPRIK
jgi:hypothetical protein